MKTVTIKNWRSEHEVLVSAMTKDELTAAVRKDGSIQAKVSYPLDHMLDESRDGVNSDMATAITGEPEGMEVTSIELAGREATLNRLILKVTGKVLFDNL